ncbi:MAG TPA: hypothetical protein VEH04_18375 [Verrucomicrobiae bacterium]|nr:hypothetical protein [Verrucomicrobiae bacterium]
MKPAKVAKAASRKKDPVVVTPKPSMLKTPCMNSSAPATKKPVTVLAKADVGFGNALYLRGEGDGLSWNQGVPLTCVDGTTWKWSGEIKDRVKFKLLLNDCVWAQGEDVVAAAGQKVEVTPAFS